LLSYYWLSKKPSLFKSFTELSVEEFDDIYDREITKIYERQMRYKVHPKEKYIEKECMERVGLSNWILKIDFSCF
jgi:hypothetical protein